jgi:hypothetical protein
MAIISALIRVTARYLKASTAFASSVDLFGDAHRAKLGADPSTHASRYEKPRSERPCFANQGDGEARRDQRFGAEPLERRARVHRQDDADCEAGRENQRRGSRAELIDMTRDFAGLVGRAEGFDAGASPECGQSADELEQS